VDGYKDKLSLNVIKVALCDGESKYTLLRQDSDNIATMAIINAGPRVPSAHPAELDLSRRMKNLDSQNTGK
jgi:hypothetical protein